MKGLSLAVLALISNISAVNLKNEVDSNYHYYNLGQKESKFIPFAGFVNGQQQKSSKPSNRQDNSMFGSYSRSGAAQISSTNTKTLSADDFDQEDSRPINIHSRTQVQRDDEDSLQEAQARQEELAANKAASDAKDQADAVEASNRAAAQAAAAKKAFEESEWKRKFNEFDGLVHEDDGSTWNKGDGLPVGGVNKYLKIKNKHHKKHHHQKKGDDDTLQEKQAKEDEKAALNAEIAAKEKAAAAKAEWERKHNQFDGLVHEDDGKTYGLDGQEVKGVNKFIRTKKLHGKHHKKSHHMRDQAAIQYKGVEVADRNQDHEDEVVAAKIELQKKRKAKMEAYRAQHAKEIAAINSRTFNAFDGLLHDKQGRKFDPNDGHEVTMED